MKAINRNQAMEIYNNLSDLAHALAESFGSSIETCKDPICIRYRKFSGVDELREDDLLIVDENETPMFFLDEYHMDKTKLTGGIMSVPSEGFKEVYRVEGGIVAEYTDGALERYEFIPKLGVYCFHSSNRLAYPVPLVHKNWLKQAADEIDLCETINKIRTKITYWML